MKLEKTTIEKEVVVKQTETVYVLTVSEEQLIWLRQMAYNTDWTVDLKGQFARELYYIHPTN